MFVPCYGRAYGHLDTELKMLGQNKAERPTGPLSKCIVSNGVWRIGEGYLVREGAVVLGSRDDLTAF